MTERVIERRSPASQVLDSPLRYVAAAIAVSSGFAYVLEAEDQFHRAVWFGVLFAAITGGWFIIGSFLTLVDTRATWQLLVGLSVGSLALWGVGQFVEASEAVDDVGDVSEPLTQVRLAAALLLIALGLFALRARHHHHRLLNSGRAAAVAGIVVFVLGIFGTVIAATVQSFSAEGDCGPEQVQAGRSECADS
jgi:drug/metabolite transporter (DMT)-like permease